MVCAFKMGKNHTPGRPLRLVMIVNVRVGRVVVLMLCTFCSLALARDLGQNEALRLREQGIILPLEQLLQSALQRHPGAKLLEVELEEHDDIYIYEVELLTLSGVVREIKLNASNGELLKDKVDD